MSLPEEPIIPISPTPELDPDPLPPFRRDTPRRRRATRRSMFPTAEGQAALVYDLSRRAYPSIELFVLSLTCGAILGLGYLADSKAILLLGILAAPLMTPWVGFLLSILTGSPRFFFETSMALLISAILVFIGGAVMGVVIRLIPPITLTNIYTYSKLWIPELAVLVIGAITLVASFIRSESKPFLPSVLVAYMFYLPINAAGFGVGSGLPTIWPQAIFVFFTHFVLASIIGLATLFAFRFRTSTRGIVFSGVVFLSFVTLLAVFMMPGFPLSNPFVPATATPTATPTVEPTLMPSLTPTPTATITSSPIPSETSTPSVTPTEGTVTTTAVTSTATEMATATTTVTVAATPTASTPTSEIPSTATLTLTATPTPQLTTGTIKASEGGGANLRQTPNGKYLMTLDNGMVVEIYPDFKTVNGVAWIHVAVTRNGQRVEGWLLESVVSYSTPAPNFSPSATPTTGITPAP
ncbi:MAG: hypothetical protein HY865_10325 [Chloroflexi bacterium]|nr:hypothetical protein [Chloroflexota bacterium]